MKKRKCERCDRQTICPKRIFGHLLCPHCVADWIETQAAHFVAWTSPAWVAEMEKGKR